MLISIDVISVIAVCATIALSVFIKCIVKAVTELKDDDIVKELEKEKKTNG